MRNKITYEDIYIKTYTIGYTYKGESCIFLLYSEKPKYKVHYSIVIDSYVEQGRNKTIEILEDILKRQKLDMLIWTHPHEDHYLGLVDIIEKYCNKYTKILTPAIGNDFSMCDASAQEIMHYINSLVHNRSVNNQYTVKSISDICQTLFDEKIENVPQVEGIRFEVISPFGQLAYYNGDVKHFNINRMSIGVIIQVYTNGEAMYFLYTGDMDQKTIELLEYRVENGDMHVRDEYTYIKIPHHGSAGSENLINILSNKDKSKTAVSTVFTPQNLPNVDVIENYRKKVLEVLRTDEYVDNIVIKEYVFE